MSPRLTAIASGKGGTGKTFIAVSLAVALAEAGERVLLCDADLGLSNTSIHLGLDRWGDLGGVLAGRKTLCEAVARVDMGRTGFDLLAAPAGTGQLAQAQLPELARLTDALEMAGQYDRVLLDLGAGVGEAVLTLSAHADETLLVLSPDPASLTDGYAFVKLLLKRTGSRPPSLVVNMAANASEGRRVGDALRTSAKAFLKCVPQLAATIPLDPHVAIAIRRQTPLDKLFPQCPAALALNALAGSLHGAIAPRPLIAAVR